VDGRVVFSAVAADSLDENARARRVERRIERLLERPDALGRVRQSLWSRLAADVQASVESAFGRLLDSAVTIIPRALAAFHVFASFGLLAAGVRRLMRAVFRRVVEDLTFENLVKQIAYFVV
jgi:hypothetical protein